MRFFSNITVKLNNLLRKRSVPFCTFSFCSGVNQSLGVPDVFFSLSPLANCFVNVSLPLIRQASQASSLCDKHRVLLSAPEDLAPHWDSSACFPVSAPY